MWKYPIALAITAAVICGSVYLFRHREELFRPDVSKVGGTRIVFAVEEGSPQGQIEALRNRFDPERGFGLLVTATGDDTVEFLVPNGPQHDNLVERIIALAWRSGSVAFRGIAHEGEDVEAIRHVKRAQAAKKGPLTAPPSPPVGGLGSREFLTTSAKQRRYQWARLSKEAVVVFGLDSTSLATRMTGEKEVVARSLQSGAVFSPEYLPGAAALAANLPGLHGLVFYLLLIEDDSLAITNEHIRNANVRKQAPTTLQLRLNAEGNRRMAVQMSEAASRIYSPSSMSSSASRGAFNALVVDGEITALPQVYRAGSTEWQMHPGATEEEAEQLACLFRGRISRMRLSSKPTAVTVVESKK